MIFDKLTIRAMRTADTALRLGAYFGTSAEMWMSLQAGYEMRLARRSYWPEAMARIV